MLIVWDTTSMQNMLMLGGSGIYPMKFLNIMCSKLESEGIISKNFHFLNFSDVPD